MTRRLMEPDRRTGLRPAVVAMGLATAAFAFTGGRPAEAATFISVACGNVTGLINAIDTANASSTPTTITLGSECSYILTTSNNTSTNGGDNGLPVITNSKTITIKSDDATIARSNASGTPAFRIFEIAAGASLVLKDIHVEGGLSSSNGCGNCGVVYGNGAAGGGIYNSGTLTLTGSYVVLNATGNGNGCQCNMSGNGGNGGGIYNAGTGKITMTQGSVSANTTGNGGGFNAVAGSGGSGGGIFNANGVVKLLTGATVSGNATGRGGTFAAVCGNGGNGGGIENEGSGGQGSATSFAPVAGLTLNQALVASNVTGAGGSGICGSSGTGGNGGGIDNRDAASAVLIASTVKLNAAAGDGGGIYNLSPSTVVLKMGTKVINNTPDNCVGC